MKQRIKKIYSILLKSLLTTRITEDRILVYNRKTYLFWNLHSYVKGGIWRKILYYWDSFVALLFDFYAELHDGDEDYLESVENDEEFEVTYDQLLELEENMIEELTPIDEMFEDIFNIRETGYVSQRYDKRNSYKNLRLIPNFYYDVIELDLYPFETNEGELLGGVLSPFDVNDTYYTNHSINFGTFSEYYFTAVGLIPMCVYVNAHLTAVGWNILMCFSFYHLYWNEVKQGRGEEDEDWKEFSESENLLEKITHSFIYAIMLRIYIKVFGNLGIQAAIIGIIPVFIIFPFYPVLYHGKIYYQQCDDIKKDFYISDLVNKHIFESGPEIALFFPVVTICFCFLFFWLPLWPVAVEKSNLWESEVIKENLGLRWFEFHNWAKATHPVFPTKLTDQLKLTDPISVDVDWMMFEHYVEDTLVYFGALHYYFLDNSKEIPEEKWEKWKRWAKGENIKPVKLRWLTLRFPDDHQFNEGQFSTERLIPKYWHTWITGIVLPYWDQEGFRKWDGKRLTKREIQMYKQVREGIFKGRTAERIHPSLRRGEEHLMTTPGVYSIYKKRPRIHVDRLKKGRLTKDCEEFLKLFEKTKIEGLGHESEVNLDYPKIDNYIYWLVKRSEGVKRVIKERKPKRVEYRMSKRKSKLIFYLFGKGIVPITFLFLKILSFFSILLYLLRDVIFYFYEKEKVKKLWNEIWEDYVIPAFIFFERRTRAIFTFYLYPITLGLWAFLSGSNVDVTFGEEEETALAWWVNEHVQDHCPRWTKKERQEKIGRDPFAYVRKLMYYGRDIQKNARPAVVEASIYSWYNHEMRREFFGNLTYGHGISRIQEDWNKRYHSEGNKKLYIVEYDSFETYHEEKYLQMHSGLHADLDITIQRRSEALENSFREPRRTLFSSGERNESEPSSPTPN